jgi:hypothetical protein
MGAWLNEDHFLSESHGDECDGARPTRSRMGLHSNSIEKSGGKYLRGGGEHSLLAQ